MKFLYLTFLACALQLTTQTLHATPESDTKEKPQPYLDIQVVPVGSMPLARFGKKKQRNDSSNDEQSAGRTQNTEAKGGGPSSPKSSSGLVVINQAEDERPPNRFYIKHGDSYLLVNCQQNCIGVPIRIPLRSSVLSFYSMKRGKDGSERYKKAFTYNVQPQQKRVLITLSKPLLEKKWTNPVVRSYDLSPHTINDKPAVLINASTERYIGAQLENKQLALAPHESKVLETGENGAIKVRLAASSNRKKWSKPQRLHLPVTEGLTHVVLTYAVSPRESFRGFKAIRGKIREGQFRRAVRHLPKRRP